MRHSTRCAVNPIKYLYPRTHEVKEALRDLHKQATEERSHYYVGSVVKQSLYCIQTLEARVEQLEMELAAEKGLKNGK